ncbi:hypothetical protein KSI01_27590 [Kurthia sibirica]|nr:hypothetical protein KSI01_27590 [Kurthia sibirica]
MEEEFDYLLALSDEEFPMFKESKIKSNTYGEIMPDTVKI